LALKGTLPMQTELSPITGARAADEDERGFIPLDGRARLLMLGRAIALAILQVFGLVLAALTLAWLIDVDLSGTAYAGLGVISLLLAIMTVGKAELTWRVTKWRCDRETFEFISGIVGIERTRIPLHHVQTSEVRTSPLGRLLGLDRVTLSTAAGAIEIPALPRDDAARLQRIVTDDGAQLL
jgi:membrane protein YdbS with pleckstrin-like domain